MSLHDYLHKYFPNGPVGGSFESQTVDLIPHMLEKFGVNVKQEGDLFLFKYDQLLAKFSYDITHECRGHIWRYKSGNWYRVCNPADKFFNLSEGNCKIFNQHEFEPIVNQLCAMRKEDGTLCDIWFDDIKNDWRCSTSGMISPMNVGDYDITFDTLFWKLFGENKKEMLSKIGKEYTFCFELCSVMNRIVSKYSDDRVYLLFVRHTKHGTYVPCEEYAIELGVKTPEKYFLYQYDIKNKDDLNRWVENNCNDDPDCSYKEGFVLYHNLVPIAKCKTEKYRVLHSISGADIGATRNNLIELFFSGGIDDVYGTLVDSMKIFVDKMREWYIKESSDMINICHILSSKKYETQKDYALDVLKQNKIYSGFYFQNKDKILNKSISSEDINWWFKQNYKKFDSVIKSL